MRNITNHQINGLNAAIGVTVLDEPGPGGANRHYMLTLPDWTRNPDGSEAKGVWDIQFQNGPVKNPLTDANGITNEALLAILIDRMRGFQSGQFACRENALALTKLEEALMWLQSRTIDRISRGVEGSLQK